MYPRCTTKVQIMRYCKYCGAQISDQDTTCPICKKYVGVPIDRRGSQTSVGKAKKIHKAIVIGAVAFILVVAEWVALLNAGKCHAENCKNKSVDGSKYCYSHKCTFPGCSEAKYMYSNYCYEHFLLYDDDAKKITSNMTASDIKVDFSWTRDYGYITCEGSVKNNGDVTISDVKVKIIFKNSSGDVIDTDWTYAVGSEGLAPGESCKWSSMTKDDSRIRTAYVTVLDFDV